jgi:uncharacterized protein involved in outer membrane biogenesis
VLVVVAAAAVALHYVNPRAVAASVVASVKADTGRELEFGDVNVKLFPRPALVLSQVRYGNAAWGSQPWMATVGQAEADIGLIALLKGQIRVTRIVVTEASLLLETDAKGNGNWVTQSASSGLPEWLTKLGIDELRVQPVAFTWRDGTNGQVIRLALDAVVLEAPAPAAPIRFHVHGQYGGATVTVQCSVGGLDALLANGAAYPVEIDGTIGAATVSVRGSVDKPLDTEGLNFALIARGPEIAEMAALAGEKVRPLGPFRVSAKLTGTPGAPVFSGIDLDVGAPESIGLKAQGGIEATAPGSGTLAWSSPGLDIQVQGTQLHDLGELIGKPLPALGPYRFAGRLSGSMTKPSLTGIDASIGARGRIEIGMKGTVGDLRAPKAIDLQVAASSTEWWRAGDTADAPRLPPFSMRGRLRDAQSGYTMDGLDLTVADSTVNASLAIVTGGARPRITVRAASPAIDLGRLVPKANAVAGSTSTRGSDRWRLADVDLDLQIGRLVLTDKRVVQQVAGRVSLADGRLSAKGLQATFGGAKWQLDGAVAEPAQMAGMDVNVSLQGNELADLWKFFGGKIPAVGPYRGSARARGSFSALQLTAIDAGIGRTGQRLRGTGEIRDTLNLKGLDLALTASVSDSVAAGRLFGASVPRLPVIRVTGRVTDPQGGYVIDGMKLSLGRSSVQGRVAYTAGQARPRITANLTGALVDLSELPSSPAGKGKDNPLLAADVDADIRFDRVVLPDKRALGPVSGKATLAAGAIGLKQFTVAVDGASATLDGRINDPLTPAALDLMVNVQIKRMAGIEAFTGLDVPDLTSVSASGRLTDVANGYSVAGLKFVSPATTITGDVTVTRGPKRYKVIAKTSSPMLDVSAFIQPLTDTTAKPPPPSGARMIPDTPLPLDLLRAIDADLDVRIDQIKFSDAAPLGPLVVHAVIADGSMKADPVQVTIQAGQTVSVSGTIDAAQPKNAAWALRLDANGIDLGEFLKRTGRPGGVTGGPTDVQMQFTGRGNTMRALLGGMTGTARVSIGAGRLHNVNFNLGVGLLQGMFNYANPFRSTDPDTDFRCFAMNVPIRDGLLTSDRNIAAETTRFNLIVSGTVNLRTEALDLGVTPVVTQGLGLGSGELTRLVRVRGTLADPQMGMNAVGAAQSAASLGLAVWTLGGSLLLDSLVRRATNDPNPCATALSR